jgi:hypothetical protein
MSGSAERVLEVFDVEPEFPRPAGGDFAPARP